MNSINRYIFRQLFTGFVIVAISLVCVLWLTQSLRFVEMIVNRGLGIGTFVYFTALLLPNFLTVILPVALFSVIVFVYSKLNMDRELPVLRACGMSNWAIARPAFVMSLLVLMMSYSLNLYLVPKSYQIFKELQWELRHSLSHLLLREGAFNDLGGKVTVYIRERTQEGQLLGILVHDESEPERPITLMAERGALVEADGNARVIMFEGNRQLVDQTSGKFSMLYFDRYTHDVPIDRNQGKQRVIDEREMMVPALLEPHLTKGVPKKDYNNYIVEGHQRLLSPFLTLSFSLCALAFLVSGQFSRRGQIKRIMGAIGCIILIQALFLGLTNMTAKNISLLPLLYITTFFPFPIFAFYLTRHRKRNPKQTDREKALFEKLEAEERTDHA